MPENASRRLCSAHSRTETLTRSLCGARIQRDEVEVDPFSRVDLCQAGSPRGPNALGATASQYKSAQTRLSIRRLALSVALLTLVSCGGDNRETTPTQPVNSIATTIELSSESLTFASLSETQTLTAAVNDHNLIPLMAVGPVGCAQPESVRSSR